MWLGIDSTVSCFKSHLSIMSHEGKLEVDLWILVLHDSIFILHDSIFISGDSCIMIGGWNVAVLQKVEVTNQFLDQLILGAVERRNGYVSVTWNANECSKQCRDGVIVIVSLVCE